MKKKTAVSTDYPQTEQERYEVPGNDASPTNALHRCEYYDLIPGEHRVDRDRHYHGHGSIDGDDHHHLHDVMRDIDECLRPKEQTFTVVKPGNQLVKDGSF